MLEKTIGRIEVDD